MTSAPPDAERGERPLRVVLAIDELGSGGAQRQLVELAAAFQRGGRARVTVVVYSGDDFFLPRLEEAGVPLVHVPRRSQRDPLLGWRLRHLYAQLVPDVVHAFLLPPALWSLLAIRSLPRRRRPLLVAGVRGSVIAPDRRTAAVQRLVYRGADAVTANAAPVVDALHERLGVPRTRLHHLPNGIDLARWDSEAKEDTPLPLEPGLFHLALVGGLRPEKGHAVLFEALARLGRERMHGLRVWCLGGPNAGPEAERAIRGALARSGVGDVVRLEPPVRNVAALMARLDAVVLPSLHEGFPNAVLEGMASGLPVVATRVGHVPHLVEEERSGLLVVPDDADALASALQRLVGLPAACRRAMGRRGRQRVEADFSLESVAARYLDLYVSLVRSRGA